MSDTALNLKKVSGVTVGELYNIPVNLITVDPTYNERDATDFEDDDFVILRESIRENGVQTPLRVRKAGQEIIVVSGHRRLRAVQELNASGAAITHVPATVEKPGTTEAERDLALLTDNNGKPLSPVRIAAVCARLQTKGWSDADIATKAGFSPQMVRNYLVLHGSPEGVKSLVTEGKVSATLAYETVVKEGPEKAEELLKLAVEESGEKGRATAKSLAAAKDKAKAMEAEKDKPAGAKPEKAKVIYTNSARSIFAGSLKIAVATSTKNAEIIVAALTKAATYEETFLPKTDIAAVEVNENTVPSDEPETEVEGEPTHKQLVEEADEGVVTAEAAN